VVINFIFTGCVTVCPPQTVLLRQLRKQLDAESRDVLLLSLTVDPLHDQPQQLREFASRYNIALGAEHNWLMLTGPMRVMAQALAAFDANSTSPSEHPTLLWVGNEPRQRWTRSSSLNPAQTLLRLIDEVQT
jgi:protein SCO1